jgi:adenylylsulfate kinase
VSREELAASAAGGLVTWLTGLPSSGKSTLSGRVAAALRARGDAVVELDGDAVRAAIVPPHGYDEDARAAFYETLARLAASIAAQGLVVLVPATASRAAFRARARELAPRYLEVFVDVDPSECARRDAKGLYARRAAGLPGAGAPFERPAAPDVVTTGAEPDAARVVAAIDAARAAPPAPRRT